jgi:hypothetical protein
MATQLGNNIILPQTLIKSLLKAIPTTNGGTPFCFVVANTGATDHMVPDCSAFISYKSVHGLWVRMGNNSFALVLGCGMAIISLNGQRLLIRHVLHVPELWVPLYSLRAHVRQLGCGFVGSHKTGLHVYFLGVVLTVNTSLDSHLAYKPLGKIVPLLSLHYIQPRCPPVVYPPDSLAFLAQTRAQSQREQLVDTLCEDSPAVSPSSPLEFDTTSFPPSQPSSDPHLSPDSPTLLSTLSREDITCLIHHEGYSFPPVCPCDWANGSNTKTHWTSKELHCALGCRCFRNYKHILQTSLDSTWIDGGEFPLALGSYDTIPKAKRGGDINQTKSYFLDVVHVDIAFGDCVLVVFVLLHPHSGG